MATTRTRRSSWMSCCRASTDSRCHRLGRRASGSGADADRRDEVGDRVRGWMRVRMTTWSSRSACWNSRPGCVRDDRRRPVVLAEGASGWIPPASRPGRTGRHRDRAVPEGVLPAGVLPPQPRPLLTHPDIIEAVWDFAYDGACPTSCEPVREVPAPQGGHPVPHQDIQKDRPRDGLPAAPRRAGVRMSIRLPASPSCSPPLPPCAGQLAVRGRAVGVPAGLDRYPARKPARPGLAAYPAVGAAPRRPGGQATRRPASPWSRSSTPRARSAAAARTPGPARPAQLREARRGPLPRADPPGRG